MAEKSNFFDSVRGDRAYYAADFAKKFATFFSNGVFNNGLQVISNNDMTISVKPGDANINGYGYSNDANKIIQITNADGVLNRVDNIVIRLDLINRQITAEVVTGDFAENAVAPQLTRGTNIFDLRIATIRIPAGTTAITADLIEDTRFFAEDCGNVICAVQNPDFGGVLNQFIDMWQLFLQNSTNNFNTWFANLKNILDENVAGNLQNQIDDLNEDIKNISTITQLPNEPIIIFDLDDGIYKSTQGSSIYYNGTGTNSNSIYLSSTALLIINSINIKGDIIKYFYIYSSDSSENEVIYSGKTTEIEGNYKKIISDRLAKVISRDDLVVISGSHTNDSSQYMNINIDYPEGFSMENSFLVSFGIYVNKDKGYNYIGGKTYSSADLLQNSYESRLNLAPTGIKIKIEDHAKGTSTFTYRVVLMKIPEYEEGLDYTVGDINDDGIIDQNDVTLVKQYVQEGKPLTEKQLKAADINKDGEVKTTDYMLLKNFVDGETDSL